MTRLLLRLGITCVVAGLCDYAARAAVPNGTTAESLLHEMLATYQTAKSYSDNGVFLVHPNGSTALLEVRFNTWFARPMHFRFDSLQKKNYGKIPEVHLVMWSNGKDHYNWESTSNRIEKITDVKKAMW